MIKRKYKCFATFFLIFILVMSAVSFSSAQYNVPATIKVGLYYSDASAHVNTALSSFNISAVAGLSLGFFKDNTFTELYKEPSGNTLTIRKDAFYNKVGSTYSEYSPTTATTATDKIGPYHIVIGKGFPDAATANLKIQECLQKGIVAFLTFTDSWQVWTGFFTDQQTAQQYITGNIIPALGDGTYEMTAPAANRIAVFDASNKPLLVFGGDTSYFRITPAPENNPCIFTINSSKYRGSLEVRRLAGSDMTVINVISLQEYLYGNVPPEIGGSSHPEALKAQALASKMYAINNIGKHGKTGFDLCATTSCQVYRGYSAEVPGCNAAIDQVKDNVITYNGKLAGQIYYFASSAGRTEDAVNVWGYSYPYLKSVEDKYEPVFSWTKTLRASDVIAKVPNIGNILGMNIVKTSETGRVTQLAVRGDKKSDPNLYTLEKCRTLFSLNSQLYSISTDSDVYTSSVSCQTQKTQLGGKKVIGATGVKTITASDNKVHVIGAGNATKIVTLVPESYTFSGKGWGHAVGLSQEGARAMGKAGITFADIVTHYFPGTNVE